MDTDKAFDLLKIIVDKTTVGRRFANPVRFSGPHRQGDVFCIFALCDKWDGQRSRTHTVCTALFSPTDLLCHRTMEAMVDAVQLRLYDAAQQCHDLFAGTIVDKAHRRGPSQGRSWVA